MPGILQMPGSLFCKKRKHGILIHMIFPGHLAAGYITTRATLAVAAAIGAVGIGTAGGSLSPAEMTTLLIAGTLLGDAPDIDILYVFFTRKSFHPSKLSGHRRYITHIPLLWLILGLGIFFLSPFFTMLGGDLIFWKLLGLLVWLCPWSHFLCDSIYGGIAWLRPFSQKDFALLDVPNVNNEYFASIPPSWRELFIAYFKNPLAYIEIGISFVAVYLAIM
jgi:hypothetical protein